MNQMPSNGLLENQAGPGPDGPEAILHNSSRSFVIQMMCLIALVVAAVISELWLGGILLADENKGMSTLGRLTVAFVLITAVTMLMLRSLSNIAGRLWNSAETAKQRDQYARLLSALPVVRAFIIGFGVLLIILLALDELGVNLVPILASAGFAGVMIGLGARSIVTDVLAGIFYISEDALRVHDFVEVCGKVGTVEHILLRSIQVRDKDGSLHTIPYSQIKSVTNMSRDWARVKINVMVPHDTNPKQMFEITDIVSKEISAEDRYIGLLLEPLKSRGIEGIDDVGLKFCLYFKSLPGEQHTIRCEILHRFKKQLDEYGIPYARRTVNVNSSTTREAETVAGHDHADLAEKPVSA